MLHRQKIPLSTWPETCCTLMAMPADSMLGICVLATRSRQCESWSCCESESDTGPKGCHELRQHPLSIGLACMREEATCGPAPLALGAFLWSCQLPNILRQRVRCKQEGWQGISQQIQPSRVRQLLVATRCPLKLHASQNMIDTRNTDLWGPSPIVYPSGIDADKSHQQ